MENNYVKEALSYYNIPEAKVILLRHNENMTFRIGTDYLLQKVLNHFVQKKDCLQIISI